MIIFTSTNYRHAVVTPQTDFYVISLIIIIISSIQNLWSFDT